MDTGQILADILVGGELKIHLIGVAGSGMSGIAGLLLALGHDVSGSDRVTTVETERLQTLGLKFSSPHTEESVQDADLVIFSSAIRAGNPAYDAAIRNNQSMVRRADALAAIMNCKKGIVVAGTHGKTTTSAMAAHVLRVGGLHPSHYVGAEIPILGTNAHWSSRGEFFVAEGDESDGTLAYYHPEHVILLNIEEEHLDFYEDLAAIEAVYSQLLDQTSGHIFYCADDGNACRIAAHRRGAISFGADEKAFYHYRNLRVHDLQSIYDVYRGSERLGEVTLNVPGSHNVGNSLGVIALASELGVYFNKIVEALEVFRGARRRFEIKYRSEFCTIVDDYAHHPSELRATLATARRSHAKRTIVMFQPHRFSRTLKLKDQFGSAFTGTDTVFVTEIYPASEVPINGVTGQLLVDAMRANGHPNARYIPNRTEMLTKVGEMLQAGDMILSLGAGNVHEQTSILAADVAVLEAMRAVMGSGQISLYEPLAKHTTLRCGGPAQFWAEPDTETGFANLLRFCGEYKIPLRVLGRGSNLLVRDGGVRGLVMHPSTGEFLKFEVHGNQITAGAGVPMKKLAYAARDAGIGGFEWMEGIPGNVGGALRMNAGAMGTEMFDQVVSVRYADSEGCIRNVTPEQMDVRYRSVSTLVENYALSAVFRGERASREEIERKLEESRQKRKTTQPRAASAGCMFKNPAECPAGKLVDELRLKNSSVGAARVSEIHGNFIVNDGGASAEDILKLIEEIKSAVAAMRGIELHTEVQIIGEIAENKVPC